MAVMEITKRAHVGCGSSPSLRELPYSNTEMHAERMSYIVR
jgi:hypothetical protein